MSPARRVQHQHGDPRCYERGCRCDDCRAAYTEHARLRRRELASYNVDGVAPATFIHGAHCYSNHHCRCDTCVTGHREQVAAARVRRRAARKLINGRLVAVNAAVHGSPNTYANHGCRCDPCTDAASRDRLAPPSRTAQRNDEAS